MNIRIERGCTCNTKNYVPEISWGKEMHENTELPKEVSFTITCRKCGKECFLIDEDTFIKKEKDT